MSGAIGTAGCLLGKPEGKAPNLIVYVHGCCTNAADVNVLRTEFSKAYKGKESLLENGGWEIVVRDWSTDTPKPFSREVALQAYEAADYQGRVLLVNDISKHPYKYVHLIGHSAGSRLIDATAKTLVSTYKDFIEKPFIHLTFLDAYTPNDWDIMDYGRLPYDYQNHYSEHYVDRTFSPTVDWILRTNEILPHAFNFDVTDWGDEKESELWEGGHIWPRRWYTRSIEFPTRTGDLVGLSPGFSLSLEGGNEKFCTLVEMFPPGGECKLTNLASVALCGNIVSSTSCQ